MPRKARTDAPGALQHITLSGIERKQIFLNDIDNIDRNRSVARLTAILPEATVRCYAWAFIANHLPSLFHTGKDSFATGMPRLLAGIAFPFYRRHQRQGTLLQNRCKSILCQLKTELLSKPGKL